MINSIKNNTISEALAKQKLDVLNEIKNKRLISSQTKLLNLFDELLEAIFNNNKNENENNNVSVNENENDNDNDNDNESDDDDEDCYIINQVNNYFKTIDEIKSFEEQIEIPKKEIS